MPPRGRNWESSYEAYLSRLEQAATAQRDMAERIRRIEHTNTPPTPIPYTPHEEYTVTISPLITDNCWPDPEPLSPPEGYFFTEHGAMLKTHPDTNADFDRYYRAKVTIPIPEVQKVCEERRQKDLERQQESLARQREMRELLQEHWRALYSAHPEAPQFGSVSNASTRI